MLRAQVFRITLSAILFGALGGSIVAAHHSVAPYDRGSIRELEGVISGINWRNPHVRLTLSVTDEAKRTIEWELEGDSANAAARKGFTRESVRIGDRVKVAGWPSTRDRASIASPTRSMLFCRAYRFDRSWSATSTTRRSAMTGATSWGLIRSWRERITAG